LAPTRKPPKITFFKLEKTKKMQIGSYWETT
jgi:hypothetical protein